MAAEILYGAPVAEAICQELSEKINTLLSAGISPKLAILRVGCREGDLSYERVVLRRFLKLDMEAEVFSLPDTVSTEELIDMIRRLNEDESIHGVLLLRPLPAQIDEFSVCAALSPAKDVDGMTPYSMAGLYTGSGRGFAPCSAEAVKALLHYYRIPLAGKNAVILGRSTVVGRPLSLLLTGENATVTLCHSQSRDLPSLARRAELLITATGKAESVGREYFSPGQTVVDMGSHQNAVTGALCGDTVRAEAEESVKYYSAVPGGVGAVTTAILARHVVEAAEMRLRNGTEGSPCLY